MPVVKREAMKNLKIFGTILIVIAVLLVLIGAVSYTESHTLYFIAIWLSALSIGCVASAPTILPVESKREEFNCHTLWKCLVFLIASVFFLFVAIFIHSLGLNYRLGMLVVSVFLLSVPFCPCPTADRRAENGERDGEIGGKITDDFKADLH